MGELDPFEFMLAESLGMTVKTLRDTMPNSEYHSWRAFHSWRAAEIKRRSK